MSSAVAVNDLRKSYKELQALRGVSFEIAEGEIFGLLGPNGAGKTTTVEILEGYRKRDGGTVTVLGEDPSTAGLDENLALFAGYYSQPRPIGEVVELVGLEEKRDALVRSLSGGQRRRLDLGLALVGDPEIVFLDEPTTGFDPEARRRAWQTIASLRDLGKTILLTTHYLEEAERLSDRVAVLRDGEIVALGPPSELTSTLPATEIRYRRNGQEVVMQTEEPTKLLHDLTRDALAAGHELEGLEVRRASLEDVYLSLTKEEEQE